MNRAEKAQERRQEGERHVSGTMGAENREGHQTRLTASASHLPLWQAWALCGIVALALLIYALPDLRAWWNGEPPVMIGGQP
jgi:hypothetical protein